MIKSIIRKVLRKFGYVLKRAPVSQKQEIFVSDEEHVVKFKRVLLNSHSYFLPKYGLHRPAVEQLLNGNLQEPLTHNLVELIYANEQGSMIHAGTFFGDMLPNFSNYVTGVVYAFEPVLENYLLAKLTVKENDLSNVILMNSALSQSIGNLRINTEQSQDLHAGGASAISEHGQICTALDIDSLNASDILLIQLDVEGHELMALEGAVKTINRCRPIIAVEDNEKNCDSFLMQQKYEFSRAIPGLSIWIPNEKQSLHSLLGSL